MQTEGNCKKWMNTGGDLHTIIYFLLLQDNAWINCMTVIKSTWKSNKLAFSHVKNIDGSTKGWYWRLLWECNLLSGGEKAG